TSQDRGLVVEQLCPTAVGINNHDPDVASCTAPCSLHSHASRHHQILTVTYRDVVTPAGSSPASQSNASRSALSRSVRSGPSPPVGSSAASCGAADTDGTWSGRLTVTARRSQLSSTHLPST